MKERVFKLNDEMFLRLIKGGSIAYGEGKTITRILPPHYHEVNDDFKRGFSDGVESQKFVNRMADIVFDDPMPNK